MVHADNNHSYLKLNQVRSPEIIKTLLKVFASRGEFGSTELCPVGSYAVAFQLLVAPLCDRRCLLDDDVGLMGIRCIASEL